MNDDIHITHYDGFAWCDCNPPPRADEQTTDPLDATCTACLRGAAEFGAKAAVRCMAVENAGSFDEELKAERDAAMKDATDAKKALMDRGMFLCQECRKVRSLSVQVGYKVPGDPPLVWCDACKASA